MDIMELGAKILVSKIPSGSGNIDTAMSALSGLLGDGKGGLDLAGIVSNMQAGNIASIASSWLGSGSNKSIDADQLLSLFGSDKISQFASTLGTDKDSALSGLSEALPKIIDQGSPDSSLLDSLGGKGGLAKMAGGFFK
jgi:uncharacterized protein YidB (DUF937 family)